VHTIAVATRTIGSMDARFPGNRRDPGTRLQRCRNKALLLRLRPAATALYRRDNLDLSGGHVTTPRNSHVTHISSHCARRPSPDAYQQRLAVRQERSRALIAGLEIWLREQRRKLSSKNDTARAIDYSLKRWAALTRFLDDGRLCISNNAAERALRGIAVGRHNWTFAGSDEGGRRAAAIYTLIETAKLN